MKKRIILGLILGSMCINLIGCGNTEKSTTTTTSEDTLTSQQESDDTVGVTEDAVETEDVLLAEESVENSTDENTIARYELFDSFAQKVLVAPSVAYDGSEFGADYTADIEGKFEPNDFAIDSYWTSQTDLEIVGDPKYYGKIEGIKLEDIASALNVTDLHFVSSSYVNVPVTNLASDAATIEYQLFDAETAKKEIALWSVQAENYDMTNEDNTIRFIDGSNIEMGVISDKKIGDLDPEFFAFVTLTPVNEIDWDEEYKGDEEIGIGEVMLWQRVADDLYMRVELLAKEGTFSYEQILGVMPYLKVAN